MLSPAMSSMVLIAASSLLIASSFIALARGGSFHEDVEIHWGDGRGKILDDDGKLLSLSMDEYSGSGFKSRDEYLFGRFDVEMKLVPGNSAGTVTTFYLSSLGPTHDEIDFEFLGNLSGDPYTLHTNVFSQGKGNKEMQYHLWFDPTEDFHSYSILWNPKHIIFLVDDVPLRDFKNHETIGLSFPKDQPMRLYASLWDAENWATRGGLVKTDWSEAPFTAYYRYLNADACVSTAACSDDPSMADRPSWFNQELDSSSRRRMAALQKKYMIYDYCADAMRFPEGLPKECRLR